MTERNEAGFSLDDLLGAKEVVPSGSEFGSESEREFGRRPEPEFEREPEPVRESEPEPRPNPAPEIDLGLLFDWGFRADAAEEQHSADGHEGRAGNDEANALLRAMGLLQGDDASVGAGSPEPKLRAEERAPQGEDLHALLGIDFVAATAPSSATALEAAQPVASEEESLRVSVRSRFADAPAFRSAREETVAGSSAAAQLTAKPQSEEEETAGLKPHAEPQPAAVPKPDAAKTTQVEATIQPDAPIRQSEDPERLEKLERFEKADRSEEPERPEKPEWPEECERPEETEKLERPEECERTDRPEKAQRIEDRARPDQPKPPAAPGAQAATDAPSCPGAEHRPMRAPIPKPQAKLNAVSRESVTSAPAAGKTPAPAFAPAPKPVAKTVPEPASGLAPQPGTKAAAQPAAAPIPTPSRESATSTSAAEATSALTASSSHGPRRTFAMPEARETAPSNRVRTNVWYVAGALLLLIAAACTWYAVSAGSASAASLLPGSASQARAVADGASRVTFEYTVQGPDGSLCEATEVAEFDADGFLDCSTISIDAATAEEAEALLAHAREQFGSTWVGGSVQEKQVSFTIDTERDGIDRAAYANLLMSNTTDCSVVEPAS